MPRVAFEFSEETVGAIARLRPLLSKTMGQGRMSKRQVVELAVSELYKKHQWMEDEENASDD